ncbi:spore-associated protein A [Streptomyces sp. MBT53]|uniref:spore-associated protein A n=1 Tax=Streptomyces sp. MBT53 TaxID=1488384 RepID=UPI0019115524|nr:spore-associated protein A [Streptomyces sp. MBT53]MBK6013449.1 spore-associated protein A [Streptomyces sp. MBT53]
MTSTHANWGNTTMNMKLSRRTTTAAALAVLALGGTIAATAPASAATTKAAAATATYNGACGTCYKVIDSTPVGNSGKVFVTWNESTGKNCAVTVRNAVGSRINMRVTLDALGDSDDPAVDSGTYTSYAGPVYVNGRDSCIAWGGTIGNASAEDSGHCS